MRVLSIPFHAVVIFLAACAGAHSTSTHSKQATPAPHTKTEKSYTTEKDHKKDDSHAKEKGHMQEKGHDQEKGHPHWSYEGEGGPQHWGDIETGFSACAKGKEQSPIDITKPIGQDVSNLVFHYHQPTQVHILNNGHTVQVNYDPGSSIDVEGIPYELKQFHFHAPSEHSINGTLADAELHLVHKNAKGGLAVVGVLIKKGADHPAFTPLLNSFPIKEGPEQQIHQNINAADLLPAQRTAYLYNGSLTTPPCTEGVKWFVLKKTIELSEKQLTTFTDIFRGNNRPVQILNKRKLIEDTSK